MEKDFVTWLIGEMEKQGWNNSELARRSGLVPSTISQVISGSRRPGPDFCVGVAKALNKPPEVIFRVAGILPQLPGAEDDITLREIMDTAKRLTPERRRALLKYVLWRFTDQEQTSEAGEPA